MGEHVYEVGDKITVRFSEDDESFSCLCTFPFNDDLEKGKIMLYRVRSLALLGMAVIMAHKIRDNEEHRINLPFDVPELWRKRLDEFFKEGDANIRDKLAKILQWVEAYPLEIFPEPDLKKAAKVLNENGMTLDAISASNIRHVLKGIKTIIEA